MRKTKLLFFILLSNILLLTYSCNKKEDKPGIDLRNKVIITNEGPFQTGSGTISVFNRTSRNMTDDVYSSVNGLELGNVVQSSLMADGKLYIAVNNANKIEVIDASSSLSVGRIEPVPMPRYMVSYSADKLFVSCWDNTVKVISRAGNMISNSIKTGEGPDNMLAFENKLYVLNKGGYGNDSSITVIGMQSESVLKTMVVGGRPAGIVKDKNNHLWVLCSGIGWNGFPGTGDTEGRLVCIDPIADTIIRFVQFPDALNHPENLIVNTNGDRLYYNYTDGIHEFDIESGQLESSALVKRNSMFYGLGYDPVENLIYAADALDFAQNGWVYLYEPANGMPIDSVKAGVAPNGFIFN